MLHSCAVCLLVLLADQLTCSSGLQVEEFEAEIEALQNTKRKAKPPPRLVSNAWLRAVRFAACSEWQTSQPFKQPRTVPLGSSCCCSGECNCRPKEELYIAYCSCLLHCSLLACGLLQYTHLT